MDIPKVIEVAPEEQLTVIDRVDSAAEHALDQNDVIHADEALQALAQPKEGLQDHVNRYSGADIEKCPVFRSIGEIGMKAVMQDVDAQASAASQFKGLSVAEILAKSRKDIISTNEAQVIFRPEANSGLKKLDERVSNGVEQQELVPLLEHALHSINEASVVSLAEPVILRPSESKEVSQPDKTTKQAPKKEAPARFKKSKHLPVPSHESKAQKMTRSDTKTSRSGQAHSAGTLDTQRITDLSPTLHNKVHLELPVVPMQKAPVISQSQEKPMNSMAEVPMMESATSQDEDPVLDIAPAELSQTKGVHVESTREDILEVFESFVAVPEIKQEAIVHEFAAMADEMFYANEEVLEATAEALVEKILQILEIPAEDIESYNKIQHMVKVYLANADKSSSEQSLNILNSIGTGEHKFHAGWKSIRGDRQDYGRVSRFVLSMLIPQFAQ